MIWRTVLMQTGCQGLRRKWFPSRRSIGGACVCRTQPGMASVLISTELNSISPQRNRSCVEKHTERDTSRVIYKISIRGTRRVPAEIEATGIAKGPLCLESKGNVSKQDFSEYEKHRAQQHEELCRLAATLIHIRTGFCCRRVCRLRRICSGPMLPSPHQKWTVRVQQEIGLSGKACSDLPACIAYREPEFFELHRKAQDWVREEMNETPWINLQHVFVTIAAKRRSIPKTT